MSKKIRQTKSDWYVVRSINSEIFEMEIFGVTETTKHAIRLLRDGEELEIFHLDDLPYVKKNYLLAHLTTSDGKVLEFTRQNILETSTQLRMEDLGFTLIVKDGIKPKYYLNSSVYSVIKIQHPNGRIEERPLVVQGMRVHTPEQLEQLRSREVWTIAELRELEDW